MFLDVHMLAANPSEPLSLRSVRDARALVGRNERGRGDPAGHDLRDRAPRAVWSPLPRFSGCRLAVVLGVLPPDQR